MAELTFMDGKIVLMKGDITELDCDCIVNAANRSLLGGGGVDGAIHRAAGPQLLEACKKLKGCPTGEAKITPGFNLPARYVIHTVGPVFAGKGQDPIDLANCYWNSLELAKAHEAKSIAFPCISTGVYGYPHRQAAMVAVTTVKKWLEENDDYEIKIIFCAFDQRNYRCLEMELEG